MADQKISALPSASTPLAGSEVLPIVQGGITEKVSVDNLTAGKTVNTANIIASVADGAYALAGNAATGNVRISPYVSGYGGGNLVAFSAGYAGYGPFTIDASIFKIWVNGSERLTVGSTGNASITNGNLVLSTAGKGVTLTSPNGLVTKTLTIDNAGNVALI